MAPLNSVKKILLGKHVQWTGLRGWISGGHPDQRTNIPPVAKCLGRVHRQLAKCSAQLDQGLFEPKRPVGQVAMGRC